MKVKAVKSNSDVINELKEVLERLLDCQIFDTCIRNNAKDTLSGVPINTLYDGMPIILHHFVGGTFVIIPGNDWNKLMKNIVSVKEYIENSIWHYGYSFPGPSLSEKIYWQTLEDGRKGINDTLKVRNYIKKASCFFEREIRKLAPTNRKCALCSNKGCVYSSFVERRASENPNEGFRNVKAEELYTGISKLIKERFKLRVSNGLKSFAEFDDFEEGIYVLPSSFPNTVNVGISQKMLIKMLYYPEKINVEQMVQNYKFVDWPKES